MKRSIVNSLCIHIRGLVDKINRVTRVNIGLTDQINRMTRKNRTFILGYFPTLGYFDDINSDQSIIFHWERFNLRQTEQQVYSLTT